MSSENKVESTEAPVLDAEREDNLGAEASLNANNSAGETAVEDGETAALEGEEVDVGPAAFVRHPAELLTDDEISMLEALFKQMNTNDDGILKPKQMAEAMKAIGAEVDEETLRRQLRMGEGDDEGIDVTEFIHMMAIHMKRKLSEDDVELAFSSFDLNKDGFIDREELTAAMQHIGFHMDAAEIEEMILDADKDGDGKISFEEFKEKMLIFGGSINCPEDAEDAAAKNDQSEAAAVSAEEAQ